MITHLQCKDTKSFILTLEKILPNVMRDYDDEHRSSLLLNLILSLELYLNCTFREITVTYITHNTNVILPLWPIKSVDKVINTMDGTEEKFTLQQGNKLTIHSLNASYDRVQSFIITYFIGYDITILENLPLELLFSTIMEGGMIKNNYSTEKLFHQLRDIYGKGEY